MFIIKYCIKCQSLNPTSQNSLSLLLRSSIPSSMILMGKYVHLSSNPKWVHHQLLIPSCPHQERHAQFQLKKYRNSCVKILNAEDIARWEINASISIKCPRSLKGVVSYWAITQSWSWAKSQKGLSHFYSDFTFFYLLNNFFNIMAQHIKLK